MPIFETSVAKYKNKQNVQQNLETDKKSMYPIFYALLRSIKHAEIKCAIIIAVLLFKAEIGKVFRKLSNFIISKLCIFKTSGLKKANNLLFSPRKLGMIIIRVPPCFKSNTCLSTTGETSVKCSIKPPDSTKSK